MNNDNALMLEALAKSRSPKQVLSEGDEFEDDYTSPGIIELDLRSPYKVGFFREPGNPKGIITHVDPHNMIDLQQPVAFNGGRERRYNKATYWAKYIKRDMAGPLSWAHSGKLIGFFRRGPGGTAGTGESPVWSFVWGNLKFAFPLLVGVKGEASGFIEGEDFEFVKK